MALLFGLTVVMPSACTGFRNVDACETLSIELNCGHLEHASSLDCQQYEVYDCELTAYFECLRGAAQYEDGVLDIEDWVECEPLLVCEPMTSSTAS